MFALQRLLPPRIRSRR